MTEEVGGVLGGICYGMQRDTKCDDVGVFSNSAVRLELTCYRQLRIWLSSSSVYWPRSLSLPGLEILPNLLGGYNALTGRYHPHIVKLSIDGLSVSWCHFARLVGNSFTNLSLDSKWISKMGN